MSLLLKKKRFLRNLFSSSFFVLTRPRNFFLRSQKTDWPLLHMPEKNSFPQSRFSVVTQQSTTQISHVKTEWDKSRNTTSRHFRKLRKLSRVNFRKDLGTGQRYWPIAERRVLSNDPRSLCEIWFSPVSLSFLKCQIAPAFPSYTPFPPSPRLLPPPTDLSPDTCHLWRCFRIDEIKAMSRGTVFERQTRSKICQ